MFKWYKRWSSRIKSQMQDISQIKNDLCLMRLDSKKEFCFPMFGEDVYMYLPYASFDCIQSHILSKGDFFEGDLLRHVRKNYFQNGLGRGGATYKVLDIGANIGNHAVFFAKFCNSNVTSFEPQPAIFSILKKNIELNSAPVNPINLGLGNSESFGVLNDYDSNNTGATKLCTTNCQTNIKIVALDSLEIDNVDFIKIDVESFENQVLKGGSETITNSHPIIWIEIFNENFNEVNSHLKHLGYELKEKLADCDYIFTPVKNSR